MSPRRSATAGGGGGRTALAVVAVGLIAVALVFVVRARPRAEPFDPRSSSSDGARALVLLLERYGATVSVGDTAPAPGSPDRVLVLEDRLDDDQRNAVLDFIEGGGVAVVADPQSSLHGGPDLDGGSIEISHPGAYATASPVVFVATVDRGRCTIGSLEHLRGLAVEEGLSFPIDVAEPSCFGSAGTAFAFARGIGSGTVVGLGDNHVFTNRLLEHADNSGLATALLAPSDGARVVIVVGNGPRPAGAPDVGSGDDTLADLVHPSIWMALAQLALAFVVFAIARGIRPGRVVDEPLPAPIEGSELVAAIGNVMHRAGHVERAAALLRYDAHRRLCARVGVSPTAPLDLLDATVARRDGTAPGAVLAALGAAPPTDDAGLVALASRLRDLTTTTRPQHDPAAAQPSLSTTQESR